MEFNINKKSFLTALLKTQSIVERRNTMPILSNALIETAGDKLIVTATDLEVVVKTQVPANILIEGKITVPAKNLFEIVKELPNDNEVNFRKKDNNWVEIKCGKALFNLVGLPSTDYPAIMDSDGKNFIKLKTDSMRDMINKTIFSVSNDETRYQLNGVFFHRSELDGKIRMVATDGHRLSLIDKDMDFPKSFSKGIIIPKKGLHEAKKLLDESSEENSEFDLCLDENSLIIHKDQTTLVMRLVDGEYPDYRKAIPLESKNKIMLNRTQFLSSLKRISLLTNDTNKGVTLNIKPGQIQITSNHPEFGDAKEDIDVSYEGDPIQIGFNAKYFIDVLHAIEDDDIMLELTDKQKPGVIKSNKAQLDNYLCVVMPMRI